MINQQNNPELLKSDVGSLSEVAMSLVTALKLASRLQGKPLDRLQLHHASSKYKEQLSTTTALNWKDQLNTIAVEAGAVEVRFHENPDPARLPAIGWSVERGWFVVRSQTPTGGWLLDASGKVSQSSSEESLPIGRLSLSEIPLDEQKHPVRQLFKNTFLKHKKIFIEGALAGVIINLLALATSLYSMQVYDRVIPAQGYATLFVLTLGVGLSIVFELILKVIRSYLMEHTVVEIDGQLSREIYGRLLNVRLDQLPASVGSLSSQLRGYETIRAFLSTSTFYMLVDVPFGIFFVILIALIGNPLVALVPLFFLVVSIAMGTVLRKKIDFHAKAATSATNLKTGILVETIEGAETIKAGGGGCGHMND